MIGLGRIFKIPDWIWNVKNNSPLISVVCLTTTVASLACLTTSKTEVAGVTFSDSDSAPVQNFSCLHKFSIVHPEKNTESCRSRLRIHGHQWKSVCSENQGRLSYNQCCLLLWLLAFSNSLGIFQFRKKGLMKYWLFWRIQFLRGFGWFLETGRYLATVSGHRMINFHWQLCTRSL